MPDGEMARHAAHPADPIADGAHDLGQVLGPDEDQREDRDDQRVRVESTPNMRGSPAA